MSSRGDAAAAPTPNDVPEANEKTSALLLSSLGIMERDGLLIVIGLAAAAVALAIGALIGYVALHSLWPLVEKYFS